MARFALIQGRGGRAIGDDEIRPMVRAFGSDVETEVVRPRPDLVILLGRDSTWERPVPGGRGVDAGSALLLSSASSLPPDLPDAAGLLDDRLLADRLSADSARVGGLPTPFVALAWDQVRCRVFTDPLAARAAWSSRRPGQVVMGSEPHLLLAHPDVPKRMDMGVLAERLSYRPVAGSVTVFEGIDLVNHASMVELDRSGRVSTQRWFDWDSEIDRATTLDSWAAEIMETTEAVVEREVRARQAERSALHVSGGLDSSALAGMVAHLGLDDGMAAFTRHYPGLPCDESDYQSAVLDGTSFERRATPPQAVDLELDLWAPTRASRLPILRIEPAERADSEWARSAGRHSEFTGVGGDEAFARLHTAALEDLANAQWGSAARKLRSGGARQLFRDHVDFMPDRVRRSRVRLRPWIDDGFAADVVLADRLVEDRTPLRPSSRPAQRLGWATGGGWRSQRAESTERHLAMVGTELVPLFLDPALVALSLRIPDELRSSGDDARHLQRVAFADRLPPLLRQRRGKVHFDSRHAIDLGHPEVAAIAGDLALARAGLVDQAEFDLAYRRLAKAVERDVAGIPALAGPLWAVIGCEIWWRNESL